MSAIGIDETTRKDREGFYRIGKKVSDFLQKHMGMNYKEFVEEANPYGFEEVEFSNTEKSIKRRLFDYKAYLYLSALEECEKEGIDINLLIKKIGREKIPYLKPDKNEPTFNRIVKIFF